MDINNLDSHTYKPYEEDLNAIQARFMEMAGLVEQQLFDAVAAVTNNDSKLAEKVIKNEPKVDQLEIELDQRCTEIIALRAPAASDLRVILSTNRGVGDLERIGDEASKIAKLSLSIAGKQGANGAKEIRHIEKAVTILLRETLNAFSRLDADAAVAILEQDKQIDEDYASAVREMVTFMMEDPRCISRTLDVLWILRSLERIGDHATNICEAIVYMVKGKDIRHGNLDALR